MKGVKMKINKAVKNEIKAVLEEMELMDVNSEEYDKLLTKLERLKELDDSRLDVKTIVNNLVYIGGIVLVLHYEKIGIVTSKAVGFLRKRA